MLMGVVDVVRVCFLGEVIVLCILYFFFFSSRRRHTRLQGDWSSDVCSSDLPPLFIPPISCCGSAPLFILPISRCCSAQAFYKYQFSLRQHPHFLYFPGSRCGCTHRSEEHTSELQSPCNLVCRLLLEKKKKKTK